MESGRNPTESTPKAHRPALPHLLLCDCSHALGVPRSLRHDLADELNLLVDLAVSSAIPRAPNGRHRKRLCTRMTVNPISDHARRFFFFVFGKKGLEHVCRRGFSKKWCALRLVSQFEMSLLAIGAKDALCGKNSRRGFYARFAEGYAPLATREKPPTPAAPASPRPTPHEHLYL